MKLAVRELIKQMSPERRMTRASNLADRPLNLIWRRLLKTQGVSRTSIPPVLSHFRYASLSSISLLLHLAFLSFLFPPFVAVFLRYHLTC